MHEGRAADVMRRLARDTVQIQHSPIEAGLALRCTAGVGLPLVISLLLGHPGLGVAAAGGALCVGFSSRQGIYRTRALATTLTAAGMAFATFIGGVAGNQDWAIILVTALAGFVYGIVASIGPTATSIGQNAMLALVIASVFRLDPMQSLTQAALVLAGGLLQTFLLVVVWPFRRFHAERTALAATHRALSSYARTRARIKRLRIRIRSRDAMKLRRFKGSWTRLGGFTRASAHSSRCVICSNLEGWRMRPPPSKRSPLPLQASWKRLPMRSTTRERPMLPAPVACPRRESRRTRTRRGRLARRTGRCHRGKCRGRCTRATGSAPLCMAARRIARANECTEHAGPGADCHIRCA